MKKPYKNLNNILTQSNSELAHLISKLSELQEINQSLSQILAKELKQHCQAAKLEQNRLSLVVDSSAWASKLRFQSADLLKALRQQRQYASIQSIRIIVSPTQNNIPAPKVWHRTPISIENSRLIAEIANNIQDPELQFALKKLAKI